MLLRIADERASSSEQLADATRGKRTRQVTQVWQLLFLFPLYIVPFLNVLLQKGMWPQLWAISRVTVLAKNAQKVLLDNY